MRFYRSNKSDVSIFLFFFYLPSVVCALSICILKFHFEVCELETHLKINKKRVQEPRASGRRGNSTGLVLTGGKFSVVIEVSQESLAGT